MKRAFYVACMVVHLGTLDAVASSTVEMARTEAHARLLDFSVDATHVYVAYEAYEPVDTHQNRPSDELAAVLGIYSRSNGVEAASVDVADLWAARPRLRPATVLTVPYNDRVVVSVGDNVAGDMHLALVDRTGSVVAGRRVADFQVTALGRYRDLVLASSTQGLALFDETLDLKHAWSTPDTLVVTRATANTIIAIDGTVDSRAWVFSGTIRWLALVGDQLVERRAVEVPIDLGLILPPTILTWSDRALLVGQGNDGWQACELALPEGEIACRPAAWGVDLTASVDERRWARLSVVRSGAHGYAVTVPNGCEMWSRRYGPAHRIAPQQYVLPTGSSDLGVVNDLLVKESDGDVLMLTSNSLDGRWWGEGVHRIALHTPSLSDSVSLSARPTVGGCWSDGVFGMTIAHDTIAEDGALVTTTADDVRSCVARGANPNAVFNCGEWTRPLSQASRLDNAPTVRALVAAGADVNARDEEGDTALHLAARYAESDATLKALLDGGADATLRNNAGHTPWDYAQENESLTGSAVLRLLRGD